MSSPQERYIEAGALPHQHKFIYARSKYPALVSGLGAGKTEALIYRTLRFLTLIPKARIAIYEPTVDLIKRIIYPRFEEIFVSSGTKFKLNKSDGIMEVWLPSGKAEIIFRSMENPTRIIGYEVHHSILDEIDTLSTEKAMDVWVRVLARNRKSFMVNTAQGPKRGMNTVGITTTPEGFRFVYNMWVKDHAANPEYELIRGKTSDNHHLPEDYVSTLLQTYPPQLKKAYLDGEFVNMAGLTVYSGFDRKLSHTNFTIDSFQDSTTLHIGMDFNIGRMAATVGIKGQLDFIDKPKNPPSPYNSGEQEMMINPDSKQLYIVDEFHKLMDTPAMIVAIRTRYPDRTIICYPDASGRSRKSIDASKSDIRLLRDAGFRINAPKKNPPVRERVLSTNTMFLNLEGERNLFVNTITCPNLTEALEKQVYDDNGVPIKDGTEDINDALGYKCNRVFGLARPRTIIGRMRVGM